MPTDNRFRHQAYHSELPPVPVVWLQADEPVRPSDEQHSRRSRAAAQAVADAGVRAVFLVHGTFVGDDVLGLRMGLSRLAPATAARLASWRKTITDALASDSGNYSPRYAEELTAALHAWDDRVEVNRFVWSGQNNHIARADGAVLLLIALARFAEKQPPADEPIRVALWGHSHGGNLLALLSNLLGSDAEGRERFFHAARDQYRPWFGSGVDSPHWEEARSILDDPAHPVRGLALDMVTFGTPIRYGWDANGYDRLLHFLHHHPPQDGPEHLCRFPIWPHRYLFCVDGDYVQQVGIAGSNFVPLLIGGRTFVADQRLGVLLEKSIRPGWLWPRLRGARRVPDEGVTLLVDYGPRRESAFTYLGGHCIYTYRMWMPWQLEQVAAHLYGDNYANLAGAGEVSAGASGV